MVRRRVLETLYVFCMFILSLYNMLAFIIALTISCASLLLLIHRYPMKYGRLYDFFLANYVVLLVITCLALSLHLAFSFFFDSIMDFAPSDWSFKKRYEFSLTICSFLGFGVGALVLAPILILSRRLLARLKLRITQASSTRA